MTRLAAVLYALGCLAIAVASPVYDFITQAVLGHSPLNPKE